MTTDATLNGVALSTAVPTALILDVRRQLVGSRRHESANVPGRAGAWRFDEQPGDRTLELDIDILGATLADRRAAVVALADWCDLGTTANLIIDDEPDRYHDALLDAAPGTVERLLNGAATIPFLVGPYARAVALSTATVVAASSPAGGTIALTDKVYAEPIVELTPTGGTLTGFDLTVAGYTLSWSGTPVAAGETLTISSISDTVTQGTNDDVNLTGAYDAAAVDMVDVSGEFPLLFEGSNAYALTWTGTATSITLDLTWRERFR